MLRARGVRIVEPSEGYLACGMTGRDAWRSRKRF